MAERETGYFKGEGGGIFTMDLPLNSVMREQVTKGRLKRVNPDGTRYVEPEGDSEDSDGAEAPPATTALKAEWVGYAVRVHGVDPDDAEAMTKHDLISTYGPKD